MPGIAEFLYRKWFDETIWYDRKCHMIEIGFCCVTGNIHPERNSQVMCLWVVGMEGVAASSSKTTRPFGTKISPLPLYLNSYLLFHLQIVGMGNSLVWITLPFPSNCNHDHYRPPLPHLISLLRTSVLVTDVILLILVRVCGDCCPHAFFLDRIKSLRFQVSFLFGCGAETGLWGEGGILSNLELIE